MAKNVDRSTKTKKPKPGKYRAMYEMKIVILLKIYTFCGLFIFALAGKLHKRATCPLPSSMQGKCQCESAIAICSDLNTIEPQVNPATYYRLEVHNSDLTLSQNSFTNWKLTELILENCNLSDSRLSMRPLQKLEADLQTLSLANNSITKLPVELSMFTKIENLDVSGNPIDENNFDETILRDIGDTLLKFSFGTKIGSTELRSWPTSLKHLQKLQELALTAAEISIMPTAAFHGFEGTLLRLTIEHTKLRSVPLAISRLRYLQELHFDHNTLVGDYGVKIPIIRGFLPYLNQMSLIDDNITTFPEVLKSFARLDQLIMDQNNLKFVSDKSASAVTQISGLSLKNSGITRIPGAIQDITSLRTLDLSNNSIHAIETNDLKESAELSILRLNNNPILYISNKAFASQKKLRQLEMKNISITKVPCAIEALLRNHNNGHIVIDLSGNKIECNCGLRWLYKIKLDGIHARFDVKGSCETINMSVADYIDNQLNLCPEGVTCSDST